MALIYPYWNVNNRPHLMMRANGEGFNLSILECKSEYHLATLLISPALIYPYWNVNDAKSDLLEKTIRL